MATSPPWPAPLPLWARAAMYLGPFAYEAGAALVDHLSEVTTPGEFSWRRAVCTMQRQTPTGTVEDHAQVHFDLANLTGGQLDGTWTAADFTACEGHIKELLSTMATTQSYVGRWDSIRWYHMAFAESASGFADTGDAVRVTPVSYYGTTSDDHALPYQVSMSITMKTALRKNWGRIYMPNPSTHITDTFGRWTGTTINALVDQFGIRFDALQSLDFVPVVASARARTLFSITDVQIDDVPDVQRRRRPRQTLLRALASA